MLIMVTAVLGCVGPICCDSILTCSADWYLCATCQTSRSTKVTRRQKGTQENKKTTEQPENENEPDVHQRIWSSMVVVVNHLKQHACACVHACVCVRERERARARARARREKGGGREKERARERESAQRDCSRTWLVPGEGTRFYVT